MRPILIEDSYSSPPSKATITYYWYNEAVRLRDLGECPPWLVRLWVDIGEPFCWGCKGYDCSWDYAEWNKKPDKWTLEAACRNWDRLPLVACHIVPRSRGGTDHPSNLLLLCHVCHEEAPDVTNPIYFMEWMNNRESAYGKQLIERATVACRELGVSVSDVSAMMFVVELDGLREAFKTFEAKFSSLHWGSNGATLKMTSWMSACIEFYKRNYEKPPQEEYERCKNDLRYVAHSGHDAYQRPLFILDKESK